MNIGHCIACANWKRIGGDLKVSRGECLGGTPLEDASGIHWPVTKEHDWCGAFEEGSPEPIAKPAERVLEKLRGAE